MYDHILLPTDGSPGTDRAMGYALALARAYDADVRALFVADTSAFDALDADTREAAIEAERQAGTDAIETVRERGREAGVSVSGAIASGRPWEAILEFSRSEPIDLIVMGTHGQSRARAESGGERSSIGSIAERVVRRADVPVMTVRLREDADDPTALFDSMALFERILVPTDGSDTAEVAAEHALELAGRFDANVRALYVVDETTYTSGDAPGSINGLLEDAGRKNVERIAEMGEEEGVEVRTALQTGRPYEEILDFGADVDADLIIIGRRGSAGASEVFLGGTAARVVRLFERPVITVG